MLEKVKLTQRLDKQQYRRRMEPLEQRIGPLQRELRALGIPVAIVFEGWNGAGKGTQINRLLLTLDPRGFAVHSVRGSTEEENLRPYLWRFWLHAPEAGRITIFDRSWYTGVLKDRVEKKVPGAVWKRRFENIEALERQWSDDGAVIVKLFLHISRKEQARRFKKLERNEATSWRVTKSDWKQHRQYERYAAAVDAVLARPGGEPWHVVAAHDRRYAEVMVFETVIGALEQAMAARKDAAHAATDATHMLPPVKKTSLLASINPDRELDRSRYKRELKRLQKRVAELQHRAYARRLAVVIACEGWDGAGKGGSIRRLAQSLDPRGYEVVPIAAPNEVEKARQYLWRFWRRFPKAGHIAVFDRSWYGRVLVERVEGFCTEDEWRRAYDEINQTERQWVDFGAVLLKFWLQIDKTTQLRRFRERERQLHKQWKITEEDWRNRRKWTQYAAAVEEMLRQTGTAYAPWTIIQANNKLFARLQVLRTVVERLEQAL